MKEQQVVIITYYHFPCDHAVLEYLFAKELGNYQNIKFLFTTPENIKNKWEKWHNSDVRLFRKKAGRSISSKLYSLTAYMEMITWLIENLIQKKIKVILIRDMPIFLFFVLPLKLLFKVKVFFQLSAPHDDFYYERYKKTNNLKKYIFLLTAKGYKLLFRYLFQFVDMLFPITSFYESTLKKVYKIKNSYPLTMGVDLAWVGHKTLPIKEIESIKRNNFIVTYFGSLDSYRNTDFLIDIFMELRNEVKNVKLILMGKCWDIQEERALIEKLGSLNIKDEVIYTGYLSRDNLKNYLQYCDLSFSPIPPDDHYVISSPTKLYESLGNGVPVIANREILEQKKVVEESKAGILVSYNKNDFAKAAVSLLLNDEQRLIMKKRGKQYILDQYSYKRIAQNISTFFN